ncbi:MAG: leucyl aminopeptidase [Verrucomicrobiales bacterium]|nr:leucyl aminopeptidase [Verrucomicrobiales bacterium]|tara:strand:- start:12026 stop:13462 length:1437 start_codon:yes stop_codon:yes gene_type:complete
MKTTIHTTSIDSLRADVLVWPVTTALDFPDDLARFAGAQLDELAEIGETSGKPTELTILHAPLGESIRRHYLLGVGDVLSAGAAFKAAGQAVREAVKRGAKSLAIHVAEDLVRPVIEGAHYGSYQNNSHRTEAGSGLEALIVCTGSDGSPDAGEITGRAVNLTRELVNTPANDLGPVELAARAETEGRASGLEVEVLDEVALRDLGAGAHLAVGQGSARPPRLVRLSYTPANPGDDHLCLVGKGITFDTGGLSLKPPKSMETMKYDMGGAGTMIGAITAIGRLQPATRVSCVLALAENMPGSRATRPGDIVRAMNGKTVEILNTDAEGRLVLADALTYAVRNVGATHLVDAATLTGAVSVALGNLNVALMSNDDALADRIRDAGATIGEGFWPLPMEEEYLVPMRGEQSDLRNISGSRNAGTITAAKFLEQFVEETPWAHLDIAGTAWHEKPLPHAPRGASGIAVRTLVRVAETWGNG